MAEMQYHKQADKVPAKMKGYGFSSNCASLQTESRATLSTVDASDEMPIGDATASNGEFRIHNSFPLCADEEW